jgi:hypothetical protein
MEDDDGTLKFQGLLMGHLEILGVKEEWRQAEVVQLNGEMQ